MRYLNGDDILNVGIKWNVLMDIIDKVSLVYHNNDYCQPLKPYLRYGDLTNRIIAMPAYIGGDFNCAGIKWIASFPKNITNNLPRAHSTIILNDVSSGVPVCILNTALVSVIRTTSVSGSIIRRYLKNFTTPLSFGIIGFGPIGQSHLQMIASSFEESIGHVYIYDINPINTCDVPDNIIGKTKICNSWQEVYQNANVFITCTVSQDRYITGPPLRPSLHLNISLRDYQPQFIKYVNLFVVDDWNEVCRENTDIQVMHNQFGLKQQDVLTMSDIINTSVFDDVFNKVIMFNPMGMGIFDIAIAKYFFEAAVRDGVGRVLK